MYKSDFLKENGLNFYNTKNMSEDRCFIMKCTPAAKRIKSIPDMLYYYRQNPTSLSKTVRGKERAKHHTHNVCNIYKYWNKNGYFTHQEAHIGFLRDVLVWNLWHNDKEICKMFCDTINLLDKTLLTNEKIISQLSPAEKNTLHKILTAGGQAIPAILAQTIKANTTPKTSAPQPKKNAPSKRTAPASTKALAHRMTPTPARAPVRRHTAIPTTKRIISIARNKPSPKKQNLVFNKNVKQKRLIRA